MMEVDIESADYVAGYEEGYDLCKSVRKTLNEQLATTRAELAAKDAEIARLRVLAKANNDLAKMHKAQVQEFRQSQFRLMNELQACKDALAQWEGSHD